MVVCIRENSELMRLCKLYISNGSNRKNINTINTINKIKSLLDTLIENRAARVIKKKITLTDLIKLFPKDDINKLLTNFPIFIEPYCEFITCLSFNFDYYTGNIKIDETILKSLTEFKTHIFKVYKIVENIIKAMSDENFVDKIFLRNLDQTNKSNTSPAKRTFLSKLFISRNNSQNKKLSDLCTFYQSVLQFKKSDNLTTIYNALIKIYNKETILSNEEILYVSISMYDSYQNIRLYYNNNKEEEKDKIKNLLIKNSTIIKELYIDNLFRFQYSYLTRHNYRYDNNKYLRISNILIDYIKKKNGEYNNEILSRALLHKQFLNKNRTGNPLMTLSDASKIPPVVICYILIFLIAAAVVTISAGAFEDLSESILDQGSRIIPYKNNNESINIANFYQTMINYYDKFSNKNNTLKIKRET